MPYITRRNEGESLWGKKHTLKQVFIGSVRITPERSVGNGDAWSLVFGHSSLGRDGGANFNFEIEAQIIINSTVRQTKIIFKNSYS